MHGGEHVWHGGMHGRGACVAGVCVWQGACVAGGHVWQGACMVWQCAGQGGMHGRGHAWQILRDTVNERAVCIPLECILVSEIQTAKILRSSGFLISKLCNVTILILMNPNICPHYNY